MRNKLQQVVARVRAQGSLIRAVGTVLRNPEKAWTFWRRSGSRDWMEAVFESAAEHAGFVAELDDSELLPNLRARLSAEFSGLQGATARGNAYTPGAMLTPQAAHLYAIIRKRRPAVVVETGVCNGLSSTVILAALERNQHGHLYSIDLPEFTGASSAGAEFWPGKGGAVVPQGKPSGWLVPESLRDRWTLRLGKSSELLPRLLAEIASLDLFIHDSEHSLENQLFEFRQAFALLSSGGIIFASDINWSRAFDIFAREARQHGRHYFVDYSLGLFLRN